MTEQGKCKPKDTSRKADGAGEPARIDLNTATLDEIKSVKGIGKSRALEIVRWRDKHGPFTSLDQLDHVPHMGDMPWGEIDQVKQLVTVRIPGDMAPPTAPSQKVNVNTANVEELRGVEGIGAERAEEIVRHREEHGHFGKIDELDDLPHFRDEPEGQRGPIKARLRV